LVHHRFTGILDAGSCIVHRGHLALFGVIIMFRVVYTTKNDKGFLIDKKVTYRSFKEAVNFARLILSGGKSVGKPIVERV
jgi:hypothetical protein